MSQEVKLTPGSVVLGRYVLEAEIGRGGFGVVWRATQRSTGQPVALKILLATPTVDASRRDQERARFERELALVAKLHHPNIVRLIDSGRLDDAHGEPCIVLEFLRGEPLSALIERGPLLPKLAVRLMTQTLEALRHAHQHGVVHRDLKPQNIMVTGGDRPVAVVLDFGVSAVFGDRRGLDYKTLTANHQLLGTPNYMAPEQVNQSRDLTPAVDLYAWGLVFLECLTGQPAIASDSLMGTLMRQISDEPVPVPAMLHISVLGPIIEKALAKSPKDRYAHADIPLRDLEAIPPAELDRICLDPTATPVGFTIDPATIDHLHSYLVGNADTGSYPTVQPKAPPEPPLELAPTPPPSADPAPPPKPPTLSTPPLKNHMGPWIVAGFALIAASILAAAWLLSPSPQPAPKDTPPAATESPSIPTTQPPTTQLPITQPPATQPPATQPPTIQPPITQLPTAPVYEPAPGPTPAGMVWIPPGVATVGLSDAGLAAAIELCKQTLSNPAYCDREFFSRELPQHRVRLAQGFFLDAHEATVAAYRACTRDNACTPPRPRSGTCDDAEMTWNMPDSDKLPVNCIDATQAAAFCAWSKKRLPFEVEWEYAARGATNDRPFPWGDAPTECARAASGGEACGLTAPKPVGTHPADVSPWGVLDMGGNLSEWTLDAHTDYPPAAQIPPIWKGTEATGTYQIVRGGTYLTPDLGVRVTIRIPAEKDATFRSVGVRCALSP